MKTPFMPPRNSFKTVAVVTLIILAVLGVSFGSWFLFKPVKDKTSETTGGQPGSSKQLSAAELENQATRLKEKSPEEAVKLFKKAADTYAKEGRLDKASEVNDSAASPISAKSDDKSSDKPPSINGAPAAGTD